MREHSEKLKIDQTGCHGNPYKGGHKPIMRLMWGLLKVEGVQFRCSQVLEARAKRRGTELVVMIQPADLHPTVVAKCSCLYTVHVTLPKDEGWNRLRVVTRHEFYGRSSAPPIELVGVIDREQGR